MMKRRALRIMFEFWFHGLDDGDGPFIHHGTTHDFLEVCCQIAQCYDPDAAGNVVENLMRKHDKELSFLRVTEFELEWVEPFKGPYPDYEPDEQDLAEFKPKKIVIHKRKVA
jgi:hypothetical protein